MRAGPLRHYVDLQKRVPGDPDDAGDPTLTWVSQDHVWASIDPVSMSALAGAREVIGGGTQTALDLCLIGMYPYPGVTALDWRIVSEEGVVYDLKAARPSNDASRLVFLALVGGAA